MDTVYLVCALIGGTLLVGQVLLSLFGVGDHDGDVHHDFNVHHDVSHDHEGAWFVGLLTFRAVVAALTFFGLVGLAATTNFPDQPQGTTLVISLAAGAGALLAVSWLMRMLHRLRAEGTVRIERAVGENGTVYLKIPGQKTGVGKVSLSLQNRTVEYQAVTPHDELPTGAKVRVVAIVSSDTVEVIPATEYERAAHVS